MIRAQSSQSTSMLGSHQRRLRWVKSHSRLLLEDARQELPVVASVHKNLDRCSGLHSRFITLKGLEKEGAGAQVGY